MKKSLSIGTLWNKMSEICSRVIHDVARTIPIQKYHEKLLGDEFLWLFKVEGFNMTLDTLSSTPSKLFAKSFNSFYFRN